MAIKYKIHPAIGIARVGNSSEYYLAPETPGGLPLDPATNQPIYQGPGTPPRSVFRDSAGALKKQAARFRIFAYDDANPADPGARVEIGSTTVGGETIIGIEWTVHLANKKSSWFQFKQLTGSGMEGDAGYLANGADNPLRHSAKLGTSADPKTLGDPARRRLVLDPGPRTVSGANAPVEDFSITPMGLVPFDISTLGNIRTDAESNLIVLGGDGNSGTIDGNESQVGVRPHGSYANNPGWFDDTSDGSVIAKLLLAGGGAAAVDMPAWLICGPPAYAPEIVNLVTLYDTMYDVYVRELGLNPAIYAEGAFQSDYRPSKVDEVDAILSRPNLYQYVVTMGYGQTAHGAITSTSARDFKTSILPHVRAPGQTAVDNGLMPRLAGDNPISRKTPSDYLTVTQTQYFLFRQFADGKATTAPAAPVGAGVALDRASLENCVGGAFCPGIEMTWICRDPTLYQPLSSTPVISDAFRFRHKDVGGGLTLTNGADNDYSAGLEPGDATKYMAQPWQADFNECSVQSTIGGGPNQPLYWWWPAQRPYTVRALPAPTTNEQWTREVDGGSDEDFSDRRMVTNWKDLGLILDIGSPGSPSFVEIERNQAAIGAYAPPAPSAGALVASAGPLKGPNARRL